MAHKDLAKLELYEMTCEHSTQGKVPKALSEGCEKCLENGEKHWMQLPL